MEDVLNKQGIFLCDVFHLNYYGVHVLLQVCKTKENSVCVYELKTKIIDKNKLLVCKDAGPKRKETLVVPVEMNTFRKSTFEVEPVLLHDTKEYSLAINVGYESPLFNAAKKLGIDWPIVGTAYAVPLKEWYGVYWEVAEIEIEENIAYA